MLLDSCDVDIFESAYNNVGLCSDTLWMLNDSDSYQRTNQDLWINYNRVKKRYNELDSQDSLSKSNVKKVRTVRDVIPHSNLAKYGNYEYDEDRESLYATDDSVPVFEECDTSSSAQEPWMLPEVEQEFKRLTNVSSYEHKLWNPGSSPPNCVARRVASEGRLWASGRWWQLESWAALLLLHYPELAHTLRDTHQSSLFSDQGHGAWRTPAEPRDFELFPPPRFSVTSPEELALQLRINSAEVRSLWTVSTKSTPSPLNRRQPPPPLNADVPEFFPKAAPTPSTPSIHILPISPPTGGPRPLYFPSALGSPEELFPYREQATSTVSVPRTIPVYQRPPEFYTHQLEAVPGGRKQGSGVDYNNLIFLTSQIQGQRRVRAQQQGLLEWLQNAYPERHVDMYGMDALTEELATYEGRLLVMETPPSATSAGPLKRRLYRDVLANATPQFSPAPLLPPPPGLENIPPAVASTSSSNSLEKRFDELERLALEQYRSSEESISQCFQDLERQALEQYQCCSSSSSSGSSEGDPKQCGGGSKHCAPSGGPPRCAKRTQSQHELPAAVAKPRPVAASKSQCAIVPGVAPMVVPAVSAAASRPSAGRGGGDRSTAPGTAARRRLVLVPSEKRPPPTLDTSDSEDGGGPRLLVVAPSSRQPCRLVASVLDCGDSPAVAAAEVVMAHSPEANPNERRTQVSAEPRIQSANTVKDDPPGVPETWVQPPATEPPKPEPGESLEIHYTRPRSASPINRCKRGRRRRRQQPPVRAAVPRMPITAEELAFHTRAVRRVGLLPYDFAIHINYDQGLINFVVDDSLAKYLRTRVRRRHASWPEDADPAAPWPGEEVSCSRETIYHVTAKSLRRRAAMCLRRVIAYALPSTPQGVFLVEVQITDVRHLLTITVVEDPPPPGRPSYKKEVVAAVSRVVDTITNQLRTQTIDSQQVLETQSNHDEDYDSSLVDSDNSDLCVDDFLCSFRWPNLLSNGNGLVSTVRDILNDEKGMAAQIAKEAENKLAQSSSRMFQVLSRTKSNSSCNNFFRDPAKMDEEESHISRTALPKDTTNMLKQEIGPINHHMPDLINEVHKPELQKKNIGYSKTPAVVNNLMDGNHNAEDLVDERISDKKNTAYSTNVLVPQVVCKNVKDAVKQFLVTKTHYLHDLRVKTQNQIRNSHRNKNSTSMISPQKMGKNVVDAVKQVLLPKNPGTQDLRDKTERNVRVDHESNNMDLVSVSSETNSVEYSKVIPSSSKLQDKGINSENIIPPYSQIENTKNCYNRVMSFSNVNEVGSISFDTIIPTSSSIESISSVYGKVDSPTFPIVNNNNNNSPLYSSLANFNSNYTKGMLTFSTGNNGNSCAQVNPFSSSYECKKRVHAKARSSYRHKGYSNKNTDMIASFLPFETSKICNDKTPLLTPSTQINGYNRPKSHSPPQTECNENGYGKESPLSINSNVCEMNITSPLEIENESKGEKVSPSSFRVEKNDSDPIKTTLQSSKIENKINECMKPIQLLSQIESPQSVHAAVITTTQTESNNVPSPITTQSKQITSDIGDESPVEIDIVHTKTQDTDASSYLQIDCNNYNTLDVTSSLIENDNSSYKIAILSAIPIDSDSSSYRTSISPSSQVESDSSSCYDTVSSSPQTEMSNNGSNATLTTLEHFGNIDDIDVEDLIDNSNTNVIREEGNYSINPETLTSSNCSIPESDRGIREFEIACLETSNTISDTNNLEGNSIRAFGEEKEDSITMNNNINICLSTESKGRKDKEHIVPFITSLKRRIFKRREKTNTTNNKSQDTPDLLGKMNVLKQDMFNGMNLDHFYISDTEEVTTGVPHVLRGEPAVPDSTGVVNTSCCGNDLGRCNIAEFCLQTTTQTYKTSNRIPHRPSCVIQ